MRERLEKAKLREESETKIFEKNNPKPTKLEHCDEHNLDYGEWMFDVSSSNRDKHSWVFDGMCPKCAEEMKAAIEAEQEARRIKQAYESLNTPKMFEDVEPSGKYYKKMKEKGSILFTGGVGTGKTYQAIALSKYLVKTDGGILTFNSWIDICMALRSNIEQYEEIFTFYAKRDSLFIDDFGSGKPTEFISEFTYALVNHRYNWKLPMIITTNLGSKDIAEMFGERTLSRLYEMCSVVKIEGDDRRIKTLDKSAE